MVKIGKTAIDATVDQNGRWSAVVTPDIMENLDDQEAQITVLATDEAGGTREETVLVVVDKSAPTITIDPMTGDNILDATEIGQELFISGSTSGLTGGEKLDVTFNGKHYSCNVESDGSWSVNVAGQDTVGMEDGENTITVSVSDASGNKSTESFSVNVDSVSKHSGGSEGFDVVGQQYVYADESIEFTSGLVLTGVKNGESELHPEDPRYVAVFEVDNSKISTGHGSTGQGTGAIGKVSFGEPVDSVSFDYSSVEWNAWVRAYDENGNLIKEEKLIESFDSPGVHTYSIDAPEGVRIDHLVLDFSNEGAGVSIDNFVWDVVEPAVQSHGLEGVQASSPSESANPVSGSADADHLTSTADNDHFSIGDSGGDLLTYHLLNAADATGGNGVDRISGFTVGNGADADRIDLRELLADTGYRGSAEGQPDEEALAEFIKVTVKGNDTEIAIDRDGAGNSHEMTTLVTLSDVQTDLATLLANQQLIV